MCFADAVLVPKMSFTGMEHWGLVTYKSRAVVYTPGQSKLEDLEGIALLVAHEIAHQVNLSLITCAMDIKDGLRLISFFCRFVTTPAINRPSFYTCNG